MYIVENIAIESHAKPTKALALFLAVRTNVSTEKKNGRWVCPNQLVYQSRQHLEDGAPHRLCGLAARLEPVGHPCRKTGPF